MQVARRSLLVMLTLGALGAAGSARAQAVAASSAASAPPQRKVSPFRQQRTSTKAQHFYESRFGVDKLKVSSTNSGTLIRFTYRVSDPELAASLGDKKNNPQLYGIRSRAVLQIPVMDKVGALRQANKPESGKEYWMVFSNKGNLVRPGDRVDVVIGQFHAEGLMVE